MKVRIKHISHISDSPNTPARCNKRTGEIFINDSIWYDIEPQYRLFILLHEYAHILLQSSDEKKVDAWAFDKYISMGYPLTESVKALSTVLSGNNPEHYERTFLQLQRAKAINNKYNSMENAANNLSSYDGSIVDITNNWMNDYMSNDEYSGRYVEMISHLSDEELDELDRLDDIEEQNEGFLGLGKKARERRALRKTRRHEIRMARQERKTVRTVGTATAKENRTNAKVIKANANQTLANQGISTQSGVGHTIGQIASGLFGPNEAPIDDGGRYDAMSFDRPNNSGTRNTILYVVLGLLGAGVVGFAIWKFRKAR